MNEAPLISIIIPVFNCEKYIQQALDSIINQSYKNLEILICDDASTDSTWKIIQSYNDPRIKCWKNEANQGIVFTKNLLLSKTQGEYIAIQDADDWSDSDRIKLQLREFVKDADLGACFTNYFRIDNKGNTSSKEISKNLYLTLDNCRTISFCLASVLIKRSVYESIGGLHPFFARLYAEDTYWLSLILSNHKTIVLCQPLYYYRFNENSITNTFDRNKLVVVDLVNDLIIQRRNTGSDWLAKNDSKSINNFIQSKLSNKKWLAEKYRIFAAVQQDGQKFAIAKKLILKAWNLDPLNPMIYRTLLYILKKRSGK